MKRIASIAILSVLLIVIGSMSWFFPIKIIDTWICVESAEIRHSTRYIWSSNANVSEANTNYSDWLATLHEGGYNTKTWAKGDLDRLNIYDRYVSGESGNGIYYLKCYSLIMNGNLQASEINGQIEKVRNTSEGEIGRLWWNMGGEHQSSFEYSY
jgi:hypothetical protein